MSSHSMVTVANKDASCMVAASEEHLEEWAEREEEKEDAEGSHDTTITSTW